MTKSERPGRSLEKLVTSLERLLATSDDIHIESPAKLRDRVTNKLREHDVLITSQKSHLKIAIECRDRSRPVGVSQVEAFRTKCEDTEISKGVIVSSSSFYETAKTKASFYQIACIELGEIESVDWLTFPHVKHLHVRPSRVEAVLIAKNIGRTRRVDGKLYTSKGEEVSRQAIEDVIWQATTPVAAQITTPGEVGIPFRIDLEDLRIEDLSFDEPLAVDGVRGTAYYEIWVEEGLPFKTMEYRDVDEVDGLAELAVAQVDTSAGKENLIFARRSSDGMVFVRRDSR